MPRGPYLYSPPPREQEEEGGDVHMWIPVIHHTQGKKWLHCILPDQLYSPKAGQSLFSTHVADSVLGAVPFLNKSSH